MDEVRVSYNKRLVDGRLGNIFSLRYGQPEGIQHCVESVVQERCLMLKLSVTWKERGEREKLHAERRLAFGVWHRAWTIQ